MGQNLFQKMLAANWSDHDAKINSIINYFADRQHTGKIIRDIDNFVSQSSHYCKICLKCQKLHTYKREFNKMGFWTFNKDVKYWDVYDQDWSYRNEVFKLEPLRRYRM